MMEADKNKALRKKKRARRRKKLIGWGILLLLLAGAFWLFVLPGLKAGATTTYNSYTATKGTISKIKSALTPGAVVTTSKNDVDYIVTEYGLAHMRGETLASRAKQLIAIAHPDFRDELSFEAKKRGIII